MSAITIENAKIVSQLMSKSRSLAKISERRLQSLLFCEIIDEKLGFSTLSQGQRRACHHAPLRAPKARRNFSTSRYDFLAVSERHRL